MAWSRGTALVLTTARVTQLTGAQDLDNVAAGGGIVLTDLLVSASDAIYDQLVADGETPGSLTNALLYETAVAYHFLARLVLLGYVDLPEGAPRPVDAFGWSDPYYRRVHPTYAAIDSSRSGAEGLPVVVNVSKRPLFGGQLS